jgi:hypothetical protein
MVDDTTLGIVVLGLDGFALRGRGAARSADRAAA